MILGGGRGTRLEPLTTLRAKPAVPVGGKYRLVDIPISNAIHSGMERMVLLTQYNSHSLHRHISRTYRFDPFSQGYVQLLAAQQTPQGERWFQGTADAVRQNLLHIGEISDDLMLILAGDHMYRMDYREMMFDHVAADADVTLAVQPCTEAEIGDLGALRVDETGRIIEFREKPKTAEARAGMALRPEWMAARGLDPQKPYLASMGIYLFNKDTLFDSLDSDAMDFGKHVIPACVKGAHVQAHFFDGYWRDIGTVRAFFESHMDLVTEHPKFRFDDPKWPIYTHPRFLPCARVHGSRFERAMLGDGAVIHGSNVEDAVLGVRTRVEGAEIRRALIMGADRQSPEAGPNAPPVGIGRGSVIHDAIIDKNARIGRNVRLVNEAGVQEHETENWTIRDGIIVVRKNAVIADGTVI